MRYFFYLRCLRVPCLALYFIITEFRVPCFIILGSLEFPGVHLSLATHRSRTTHRSFRRDALLSLTYRYLSGQPPNTFVMRYNNGCPSAPLVPGVRVFLSGDGGGGMMWTHLASSVLRKIVRYIHLIEESRGRLDTFFLKSIYRKCMAYMQQI